MLPRLTAARALGAAVCVLGLAACGSGDQQKNLGGNLTGLQSGNSVTIKNNNTGDQLTLTQNGSFRFPTFVAANASYTVVIVTQPNGQTCSITNGTGMMNSSADLVNNILVAC
jgi:hypothetical protein